MSQNITEAINAYNDALKTPQTVENQIHGVLITKFNKHLAELNDFFLSIECEEFRNGTHFYKDEEVCSTVKIRFNNFRSRKFEIEISGFTIYGFTIYDSYDINENEFRGITIVPSSEDASHYELEAIAKLTNRFFDSIEIIEESILKELDSYLESYKKDIERRLSNIKENIKEAETHVEILFGGK